jgi:hypothetical protein
MKKKLVIGVLLAALSGCESMNNTEKGVVTGGLLGGGLGTLFGAAAGRPGLGAAVGAGLGAGLGGLAGKAEDRADARAEARTRAFANAHPPVTLQDVVQMTHQHIPEHLILQQIETTQSYYNLQVPDITYLRQNGVSDRVIGVMQTRRPPMVQYVRPVGGCVYVYEPPPPPVSVGVGIGYNVAPRRHHHWH